MNIDKYELYSTPFEYESCDRFISTTDIDDFLLYNILGSSGITWMFENPTTSIITLEFDDKLKMEQTNYIVIEGINTVFQTQKTFWFLTRIEEFGGSLTRRYNATMDVVATYGLDMFNWLQNESKVIDLERKHFDRYLWNGTEFKININHPSLYKSDFVLGNTKGQIVSVGGFDMMELVKDLPLRLSAGDLEGLDPVSVGAPLIPFDWPATEKLVYGNCITRIFNVPNFPSTEDNSYIKSLYLIAFLALENGSATSFSTFKQFKGNPIDDQGNLPFPTDYIICPMGRDEWDKNGVKTGTGLSTLAQLEQHAEGKVLSIILSPIYPETGLQKMAFWHGTWNDVTDLDKGYKIPPVIGKITNTICRKDKKFKTGDIVDIDWPAAFGFTTFTTSLLPQLEVALFNNDICNASVNTIFGTNIENNIDMVRFIEDGGEVTTTISPIGTQTRITIGNQSFAFDDNVTFSFTSSAGTTYLRENSNTISAQRKRADLDHDMGYYDEKSGKTQPFSGGIFGAAWASVNPATYAMSHYGKEKGIVEQELADNEKQLIQGKIEDAKMTPPNRHTGSGNAYSIINYLTTQEEAISELWYKYFINIKLTSPGQFILKKIKEFYNRFGYMYGSYYDVPNNSSWYNTRTKFDYVQINKLYSNIRSSVWSVNITTELDNQFKKGVRIWHNQTTFSDFKDNYEKEFDAH